MTTHLRRMATLFGLAAICWATNLNAVSQGAEFTSFQNRPWFDDPDIPNDGAFPGVPGPDDIANVMHDVSIRPQEDRGVEIGDTVEVNVLNMLPGGTLSMLNQITLAVDGNSAWGGGRYTGFVNGGGVIHNQGLVTVTGQVRSNRGQLLNTNLVVLTGQGLEMNTGSIFTNRSGTLPDDSIAALRFAADSDILFASGGGGAAPTILNEGVIEKTTGDGLSEIGVDVYLLGDSDANQAGRVQVDTGTIRFSARRQPMALSRTGV